MQELPGSAALRYVPQQRTKWFRALLLLCAACGAGASEKDFLDGRSFSLESAQGFELVDDTQLSVSFQDGKVMFYAGCNRQAGPFRIDNGHLVLEGLATTSIGCFGALGTQDQWLTQFMVVQPQLELMDDRLTLRGAEATLVLLDRKIADPDRPLVGTLFTIDGFLQGDAVGTGSSMAVATVEFRSDGSLYVETACSTGAGRYEQSGSHLTLMNVTYADKECPDATPSESRIRSILSDGELDFAIAGARITLKRGEVGLSGTSS